MDLFRSAVDHSAPRGPRFVRALVPLRFIRHISDGIFSDPRHERLPAEVLEVVCSRKPVFRFVFDHSALDRSAQDGALGTVQFPSSTMSLFPSSTMSLFPSSTMSLFPSSAMPSQVPAGDSELLARRLSGSPALTPACLMTRLSGLGLGLAQHPTLLWLLHSRFSVFGLDGFSVPAFWTLGSAVSAASPPLTGRFLLF